MALWKWAVGFGCEKLKMGGVEQSQITLLDKEKGPRLYIGPGNEDEDGNPGDENASDGEDDASED